jgi:hypothetical protein
VSAPRIVPLSKTAARAFIQEFHRHNEAPSPQQVTFVCALEDEGQIVAVVTAGHPVARGLDDGSTLEVSRVCVRPGYEPTKNANSRLYGAMRRVAVALGYRRIVTYTLREETGVSLRAAGFGEPIKAGEDRWGGPRRSWQDDTKTRVRTDVTLWGERRQTQDQLKYRWEMAL